MEETFLVFFALAVIDAASAGQHEQDFPLHLRESRVSASVCLFKTVLFDRKHGSK